MDLMELGFEDGNWKEWA